MNSLEAQGCPGLGLIGSGTKSFMFITYCPSTLFLIFWKLFCSRTNLYLLFWQWSVWSWTLFSCWELVTGSISTRFPLSDASVSDTSKRRCFFSFNPSSLARVLLQTSYFCSAFKPFKIGLFFFPPFSGSFSSTSSAKTPASIGQCYAKIQDLGAQTLCPARLEYKGPLCHC